MAVYNDWNPFGVSFDLTANAGAVTRKSSTEFTVAISASWKVHWGGARTNYGMSVESGGGSANLNSFGTYASSGSGSFTGTYKISGSNGASQQKITVTFANTGPNSLVKYQPVSVIVNVPAVQSYSVSYNANGGNNAPAKQTKWKGEALTLSSTRPTRSGYKFLGWSTSSTSSNVSYQPGARYTSDSSITLYAVWSSETYTVSYNANSGTNAPPSQTKYHGQPLTIPSSTPTRANYSFVGWSTNQYASTPDYRSGDQFYYDGNITLYAVWSLAYIPPRIVGSLTVARCNSGGTITDEGTYIKIQFQWQTDKPAQKIVVHINPANGSYGNSNTTTISGYSGTYNKILAVSSNSSVSADIDVDVQIWIYDNYDMSNFRSFVPGTGYIIDVLAGGKGIAFGRPATKADTMDIGYNVEVHKQIVKQTTGRDRVIDGRKNAVISCPIDTEGGFNAFANSKIDRGSISVGTVGKKFIIAFDNDENYSQGLNEYTSYEFDPYGRIIAPQQKEVLTEGNVADYVVEQGEDGRWFYRKYNSGYVELEGIVLGTPSSGVFLNIEFPTFMKTSLNYDPRVTIGHSYTSELGVGMVTSQIVKYNDHYASHYYVRKSTGALADVFTKFAVHAFGKWK